MSSPAHALVVGATGMLRGVTLALAERGLAVTGIARNTNKLTILERASSTMLSGHIYPLALDYADTDALVDGLRIAIEQRGPIQLAIVCISGGAPRASATIARHVQGRYTHILANREHDPSRPNAARESFFAKLPQVDYQEAILGYFADEESGSRRWLTEDEIVGGVLRAVDSSHERYIIGTVSPWEARPQVAANG